MAVFAAGAAASDDEDGGEGEEFVAAAAVDVQIGVEEAVWLKRMTGRLSCRRNL